MYEALRTKNSSANGAVLTATQKNFTKGLALNGKSIMFLQGSLGKLGGAWYLCANRLAVVTSENDDPHAGWDLGDARRMNPQTHQETK